MLDLLDWRRRVSEMYQQIRANHGDFAAWETFHSAKDALFRAHPQSPLDEGQKAAFTGLPYFDYDPAYRVVTKVDTDVEPQTFDIDIGNDGQFRYTRFGQVSFTLPTGSGTLNLYWINGYGGGVFLPFGDATNRQTTYGAGRYLYDTIKGADLGATFDEIVLDFNYAYHPSCTYSIRWVCPLAPPENRLPFPIAVGEKLP
jgi:uncharacterized protein (DUF1684 family)